MSKKKVTKQLLPELMLQDDKYIKDLIYCTNDNTFYLYQIGWYKALAKKNMLAEIRYFLMNNERTLHQDLGLGTYKDVFEQLQLSLIYKNSIEEHFNLDYMALKDSMFNFKTLQVEDIDNKDRKFTPFHLNFNASELQIDITTSFRNLKEIAPCFCKFLETSIVFKENKDETDYETIEVIQEMLGYYLTGTMKKTVAFFLIGNGANGKTVLSDIIRCMFPKEYVTANTLEELTTDGTRIASLIGKKLNIAAEDESKNLKNDKFKAFVSGDLIQTRRLYEESFSYTPTCKFLFITNQPPKFKSVDNGIKRRVVIINFAKDFKEEDQDRDLTEKIRKEMAVIVGWAINGAKRFIKNNYVFTSTVATKQAKMSFISDMSSGLSFMNENYEYIQCKGSNGTKGTDLYIEYQKWVEEVGKKPLGRDTFYDHLDRNHYKGYKYRRLQYFQVIKKSNLYHEADASEDIDLDDITF